MVARLLNYSHFKVETAKLLKEDRTKKSGLSSNCLFLVVLDFDFLDPSYIIADGVFFHLQELGDFLVGIAGILQSANISQLTATPFPNSPWRTMRKFMSSTSASSRAM